MREGKGREEGRYDRTHMTRCSVINLTVRLTWRYHLISLIKGGEGGEGGIAGRFSLRGDLRQAYCVIWMKIED